MSALEGHFCWEECDEGPHGCVCGNDCPDPRTLAGWARRCAVCGWLLSDAAAHVEATYEDHSGEDEPARAWRDRHGDVWTYDDSDGLMHSFETAPFPREHVEKKWGPLVPEPEGANHE